VEVKRACDAAEREDWMVLIFQPLIARFVHVEDKRVWLEDQEYLPIYLSSIQFQPVS
jgi:hypothetical protein